MYRSTVPDVPVSPHTPVNGAAEPQPCKDPDATMRSVLAALAASNAAQHTELDWQAHNKVGLLQRCSMCLVIIISANKVVNCIYTSACRR